MALMCHLSCWLWIASDKGKIVQSIKSCVTLANNTVHAQKMINAIDISLFHFSARFSTSSFFFFCRLADFLFFLVMLAFSFTGSHTIHMSFRLKCTKVWHCFRYAFVYHNESHVTEPSHVNVCVMWQLR